MKAGLFTHPTCRLHEISPDHPEQPARLAAVTDALVRAGVDQWLIHREAPAAQRDDLVRAHAAGYVDTLFNHAPQTGHMPIDADTAMNPHTLDAALHAAGAGVAAVDAVVSGDMDAAFCCVRPPGHHAERRMAMGFCFFDNIAVAALHALAVHGLERVAICDFDVHQGNGTEDIVDGDPRVLFCSTFQHPLFPGAFRENVPGQRMNCPLDAGTGGDVFRQTITDRWLPELDAFKPQMVFISAGFDAHRQDPIGGLKLVESDFHWVTERLVEVADRHAGGRIVSMLEGGYDLDALGRSAVAHVRALMRHPEAH
jgi:acetoin utilization deacetylase AcuC-like enzyme